jgi:tRNA nucleotidyltransferase (CCA-adding enzyme)
LYLYYLLKLSNLEIKHIKKRIGLSERNIKKLENLLEWKNRIISILNKEEILPSHIYYHLKNIDNELLFIILLEEKKNKLIINRIKKYLNNYKKTSTYISGHDLTQIGMKPNPIYAKILKLVLYLQLNGILRNKNDELSFVKMLKEKKVI